MTHTLREFSVGSLGPTHLATEPWLLEHVKSRKGLLEGATALRMWLSWWST